MTPRNWCQPVKETRMPQQPGTLEPYLKELDWYRANTAQEVAVLVSELSKSSRRNVAKIVSTCAKIDVLSRNYLGFMTQLNAARVGQENAAASRDELLNLRREWGVLTARSNQFRNELSRWHELRALVHLQMKPRRQKLYASETKIPLTTLSQMLASDDIFNWFHALFSPFPQSDAAKERGCFPDIGLANSDFHAHMHAAYRVLLTQKTRTEPSRFLDVGCGAGMKVYAALRYFDEAQGFDFDPAYVSAGQRFLSIDRQIDAKIFEQDALSFDGYDKFDVIYFYRPISQENMLIEMEQRIARTARPGTILIAPYRNFAGRFQDHGCGRVAGAVYLAKTSQKDADAVRRKAEQVGEYIIKSDDSPLTSVWSPIFQVSRANGYDLPRRYEKPRY
jgi:SAM-dependent methyltransferase